MKPILCIAALSLAYITLPSCNNDTQDTYYDDEGEYVGSERRFDNRHLLGNYDLQKYRGYAYFIVKTGSNGEKDGGVFGWDIDQITVVPPNEVYVNLRQGYGDRPTGAYKLDTDTGEITGPLSNPDDYPWVDVREFFTDYL